MGAKDDFYSILWQNCGVTCYNMSMKKYILMGVLALPLMATATHVGQNINASAKTAQNLQTCNHHFYAGQAPILTGNKGKRLAKNTHELCFDGFAVLHSGVSRTPIWSAEHLTKKRIAQAKGIAREDSFHAESRVPEGERAELSDYSRSGYDRGHLAPNGDMATKSQQFDSFSLANIAPQNGTHNRNTWRNIESATRSMAISHGEIYVVTGVLFQGKNIATIGTGVLVPSHFFKAVYVPSLDKAGVYYSVNGENHNTQILSVADFTTKTGINPLPAVSGTAQTTAMDLPMTGDDDIKPEPQSPTTTNANDNETLGWVAVVLEILKFLVNILK